MNSAGADTGWDSWRGAKLCSKKCGASWEETQSSKVCDVSQPDEARAALQKLIDELGGLDLIILNAGVGYVSPDLNWKQEEETVLLNVVGFTALANAAYNYFAKQGCGHIVGISSVAALVAHGDAPAYNASKAFVSLYLACLRQKAHKARLPLTITDMKPGYVDTVMGQCSKRFWVTTADTAARQIMRAIERRANHAYVTRRWRLVGWLLKATPEPVTRRLG